jgi:SAM-dependent methyltransferase
MTDTLDRKYRSIVAHYESCLRIYGDQHLGVDWSSARDADTRYRVMLDLIPTPRASRVSLLDFGCGASHLLDFIVRKGIDSIDYTGLDLSPEFIALSRRKYPAVAYHCVDVLEDASALPSFDYVVMNGVFTEKRELGQEEMFDYVAAMLRRTFALTRLGLAFNVVSAELGWEQWYLFHAPVDRISALVRTQLTENFVVRADYGLTDYTLYVYR